MEALLLMMACLIIGFILFFFSEKGSFLRFLSLIFVLVGVALLFFVMMTLGSVL